MSLLKSIAKIGKSVLGSAVGKLATQAIPGVGPVTAAVLTAASSAVGAKLASGGGGGGRNLPALPGGGGGGGGGKIPTMNLSSYIEAGDIAYMRPRRRRRKGISAKDLSSFKRVARMVDKYSKPVHKMRNFKSKKELV